MLYLGFLTTQGGNIHHNQTLEKSTKRTFKLEKSHPYFGDEKSKFLACNYFSNRGQQRIHNLLWNISYFEKPGNDLNLFSSEKRSLELVVENRKFSINLSPFYCHFCPFRRFIKPQSKNIRISYNSRVVATHLTSHNRYGNRLHYFDTCKTIHRRLCDG